MAISSNNFVDAQSTILLDRTMDRDFSGLVISKGTPKESTKGIGKDYADGAVVSVSANTLANLFEATSEEFKWATTYFSYVSKSGATPARLKFKQLKTIAEADADADPTVKPGSSISAVSVDADDFSTKVGAKDGTYVFRYDGDNWTLVGDPSPVTLTDYGITLTGAAAAADEFSILFTAARSAGDQPLVDAFKEAIDGTETFGAFTFLLTPTTGGSDAEKFKTVAKYNEGLNNRYRLVVRYTQTAGKSNYHGNFVTKNSGGVIGGDLWDIKGLTLCDEGSDCLTMARLAATDYTGTNTTGCDMFKSVGGVQPTVEDDVTYADLSAKRLNFIGLVKEHGNQWSWYMRGFNMDGTDTAVYDNEMWFKSEIVKDLLTLEDTSEKISANGSGIARVQMALVGVINMALRNGTILPGKPLSNDKRQAIIQMTGSEATLTELEMQGFAMDAWLEVEGEDYTIKYRIIYLKGDSVRKIEGSHVAA